MNIFYLDKDPDKAATMMYNKHVVKIIRTIFLDIS